MRILSQQLVGWPQHGQLFQSQCAAGIPAVSMIRYHLLQAPVDSAPHVEEFLDRQELLQRLDKLCRLPRDAKPGHIFIFSGGTRLYLTGGATPSLRELGYEDVAFNAAETAELALDGAFMDDGATVDREYAELTRTADTEDEAQETAADG